MSGSGSAAQEDLAGMKALESGTSISGAEGGGHRRTHCKQAPLPFPLPLSLLEPSPGMHVSKQRGQGQPGVRLMSLQLDATAAFSCFNLVWTFGGQVKPRFQTSAIQRVFSAFRSPAHGDPQRLAISSPVPSPCSRHLVLKPSDHEEDRPVEGSKNCASPPPSA
eukprot:TRINITY_DN316_c0_g1_i1.p1 TRINITY_DN316_c0_g1~~TRINITY_DN316_c0_g1_i1.p1  ORF type:complete len:164 (+),score=28.60 TRINITY_DN316_c0_g1_i1:239-730(+)